MPTLITKKTQIFARDDLSTRDRPKGSGLSSNGGKANHQEQEILLEANSLKLKGNLVVPNQAQGVVLFAHGSGSSRFSPRNRHVAQTLQQSGLATLLIDLCPIELSGLM